MKKTIFLTSLLLCIISIAFAETGVKKRRPLPYEYGREIIKKIFLRKYKSIQILFVYKSFECALWIFNNYIKKKYTDFSENLFWV